MLPKVSIYAVGVGKARSSDGGWGCHINIYDKNINVNGWNHNTTMDDMQLISIIKGMEYCKHTKGFTVFISSPYIKDGLSKLETWKKMNWFSEYGNIKNANYWGQIDEISNKYEIKWHFIENYQDNEMMLLADKLAFDGLEKAKEHSIFLKNKRNQKKKPKILTKRSK